MRRLSILIANLFALLLCLQSCQPDELEGKYYAGATLYGNPITGCSRTAGGVQPYCFNGGSGCRAAYECLGAAYAEIGVNYPTSYRQALDTFYSYYYADQMDQFIDTYDPVVYFNGLAQDNSGAVEKLQTGEYEFVVASGDSSILVIKAPLDSITEKNVVFVAKRDDVIVAQD